MANNETVEVTLVTCYIGRSNYIKRILASFLAQDYEGQLNLLLYNNGYGIHNLAPISLPSNRSITLINNHLDKETGKEYTNTGAIFRDALSYIPVSTTVVNFFDSDDIFLPNHVSEGVKGFKQARVNGQWAYKPKYSYHIYLDKFSKEYNNMEPSVFVDKDYISRTGFAPVSSSYHQQWLTPLIHKGEIFIKEDGPSTFLYDWTRGHNTYKISGSGEDGEANFKNHRNWESKFIEDPTLSPMSQEELNNLYKTIDEKAQHSGLCN